MAGGFSPKIDMLYTISGLRTTEDECPLLPKQSRRSDLASKYWHVKNDFHAPVVRLSYGDGHRCSLKLSLFPPKKVRLKTFQR